MDFDEAYEDTVSSVGQAAHQGNTDLLAELLSSGHPTNGHDNRGWRPLHQAASSGQVECVRLLLTADDVEVDAVSHEGRTALYLACGATPQHSQVVQLLLTAGADPDMKCGDNWRLPLQRAIAHKNLDTVKQLLAAGADANRKDYETGPPLHGAAAQGLCEIAQLLLSAGAEINGVDDVDVTALHAIMFQRDRSLQSLPMLDMLLDKGADINASTDDGTTPLMLAIQCQWREAVVKLLDRGADVNQRKKKGELALLFAIEFLPDDPEAECDGTGPQPEDETCTADLTTAAIFTRILKLTNRELFIPQKGAVSTYSIYHLAVAWEKYQSMRILIEEGVKPDVFLQETSDCAFDEADADLFRQVPLLVDIGTSVDTPLGFLLSKPLTRERVDMAKHMIRTGSSVNAVSRKCLPPLVSAVKHQRLTYGQNCLGNEVVQFLLENGADLMYKVRLRDVLPVAINVSSLYNVGALFRLLQFGAPAHKIFSWPYIQLLSETYQISKLRKLYPLFPWRVLSWLHTANMFVPQLPQRVIQIVEQEKMIEDDNLTKALNNLNNLLGTPKSLQQLCVLAVRRTVGERRGWPKLHTHLHQLSYIGDPIPPALKSLLCYTQMETESLFHKPPVSAMPSYLLPEYDSDDSSSSISFGGGYNDLDDLLHDPRGPLISSPWPTF